MATSFVSQKMIQDDKRDTCDRKASDQIPNESGGVNTASSGNRKRHRSRILHDSMTF